MPPLPIVSSSQAIRAFGKAGWQEVRRIGSHHVLVRLGMPGVLSVPDRRELPKGTLRALIRSAGMSVEEFVQLLDD